MLLGTSQVAVPGGGVTYELRDPDRGYETQNLYGDVFESAGNIFGDGTKGNQATVAADAHYAVGLARDYFSQAFGLTGIDGQGGMPTVVVHYGGPQFAARWDPPTRSLQFGDGDGTIGPYVSLDVVAHEYAHAVTQFRAGLGGTAQAGAVNESVSDIFATMVEFHAGTPENRGNYLQGEKLGFPAGFWRRMDNPAADGKSRNCYPQIQAGDDIHWSSGVGNHEFYLLAEGSGAKTVNGVSYNSATCTGASIQGIGRGAAAQVWYRALGNMQGTATTYGGVRDATINAAIALYGASSPECTGVQASWDAVQVPAGSAACQTSTPPSGQVVPNTALNSMFTTYGNNASCNDWGGGDATQSVQLPSGKRAWFFSDSFIGNPAERGGFWQSFIRNSIVVQSGGSLRTITGGNTCQEKNLTRPFLERYANTPVRNPWDASWYWTGDAMVVGDRVVKFYYRNVTDNPLWKQTNTAVASIPISSLENDSAVSITPTDLPEHDYFPGTGIIWGTSLLSAGGFVYIYGWANVDAVTNKQLFLARVSSADQLTNMAAWQFNTGGNCDCWSSSQSAARPINSGLFVEGGYSVGNFNGRYWLVQKEPGLDGGNIVAHPASTPWGFTATRQVLYTPPELPRDAAHKYQFVYEARIHPGLSGGPGTIVVSYNANTSGVSIGCGSLNDYDPSIYRPKFLTVPLARFNVALAASTASSSAMAPRTARPARPLDGHGIDHKFPPTAPPGFSAAPGARGPATPVTGTRSAASARDDSWYDQWSTAVQANGGCPKLDRVISLGVSARPDGMMHLTWDDYGRDIWYWVYWRHPDTSPVYQKFELWNVLPYSDVIAVMSPEGIGDQYDFYVVPFGRGPYDPNHDGIADEDTGRASPEASAIARLDLPAAPPAVIVQPRTPTVDSVEWSHITYPSDRVYYWIDSWTDVNGDGAGDVHCQTIGPLDPSVDNYGVERTNDPVTGFYPCLIYAVHGQNMAGAGPARAATAGGGTAAMPGKNRPR